MIGLWWSETVRLVGRKRWLAIFPAFVLAAAMNLSTLRALQWNRPLDLNVWDGVFGTLGDWLFFRFIFLLLFIFLTADNVIADISSNWSWLVLPRTAGRARWWTAKVASLCTAGLLYFLLGLVIVFLVSACQLPYAPGLSQYAAGLSPYSQGIGPLAFPAGANPFLLAGQFVLYSALAVTVFVLIPVTLSLVIRQAYLIPLIPFAWVFLSHFWQTNRLLFSIDLVPRLFYGVYFSFWSSQVIHLPTSLLYLALVGVGCYCFGLHMANRVDF